MQYNAIQPYAVLKMEKSLLLLSKKNFIPRLYWVSGYYWCQAHAYKIKTRL